jgi:hypothetical protein
MRKKSRRDGTLLTVDGAKRKTITPLSQLPMCSTRYGVGDRSNTGLLLICKSCGLPAILFFERSFENAAPPFDTPPYERLCEKSKTPTAKYTKIFHKVHKILIISNYLCKLCVPLAFFAVKTIFSHSPYGRDRSGMEKQRQCMIFYADFSLFQKKTLILQKYLSG